MKIIVLIFSLSILFDIHNIQGKWKLYEYEAFLNILTSDAFKSGTDQQRQQAGESFQFALDNTYYLFKIDSVYFSDAGAGIVKQKNGKWLVRNDTLIILESGKFKTHKFLIESISKTELNLKMILPNGIVNNSLLKFKKIEE
jgi:hypothetical protein